MSSPTEKATGLEKRLGTLTQEATIEFKGWLLELQDWITAHPAKYLHSKYTLDEIQPLWIKSTLLTFLQEEWERSEKSKQEIYVMRVGADAPPVIHLSETILNAYLDAALSIINTNIQIFSDHA